MALVPPLLQDLFLDETFPIAFSLDDSHHGLP